MIVSFPLVVGSGLRLILSEILFETGTWSIFLLLTSSLIRSGPRSIRHTRSYRSHAVTIVLRVFLMRFTCRPRWEGRLTNRDFNFCTV